MHVFVDSKDCQDKISFNPMDIFEKINKNRLKCNFPSKEYKAVMLKHKEDSICKMEWRTCKFYLSNSKKYLKKNIKSCDNLLYTEYLYCLLDQDIEKINKLRAQLEPFSSFVDELDQLLSNLNYDVKMNKPKCMWNDIEITFATEAKKQSFINKTYVVDDKKYNNMLILYILKLENKIAAVKKLIIKDNTRISCIKKKFCIVGKVIDRLLEFLNENYVESSFLCSLKQEIVNLIKFYTDFTNCPTLSFFEDIKENIMQKKEIKNQDKVKNELIKSLKGFFCLDENQVDKVPFLPEFYDIAYDYIAYPSTDLNEMVENIDIK